MHTFACVASHRLFPLINFFATIVALAYYTYFVERSLEPTTHYFASKTQVQQKTSFIFRRSQPEFEN